MNDLLLFLYRFYQGYYKTGITEAVVFLICFRNSYTVKFITCFFSGLFHFLGDETCSYHLGCLIISCSFSIVFQLTVLEDTPGKVLLFFYIKLIGYGS